MTAAAGALALALAMMAVDAAASQGAVPAGDYGLAKLRPGAQPRPDPGPRPGAFQARLKWFTAAAALPARDALRRALQDATPFRHSADLRLMWRPRIGRARLLVAHATSVVRDPAMGLGGASGVALERLPAVNGARLLKLGWQVDEGANARLLHRFDRLAIEWRSSRWAVTAGRQAVSWGAGLVFQPLDVLSPFAPTEVDQDYKPGDDLLLVERLFASGADLQLLAVARRAAGQSRAQAASLAAKYRAWIGEAEFELTAGRHRGDPLFGIGARVPVRGAMLRSDIVYTRGAQGAVVSGVLNADYTVAVAGTALHLFAEYFHNGHGVGRLGEPLPANLRERLARGEVFNLMRDYLALGASFRWHHLVNQSAVLIANLRDGSAALQASLTVDASDAARLQAGIALPFGDVGEEFGGIALGRQTAGGAKQMFLRAVYYF